jgi:ubiquitin-like protein Pup
MAQKQKSKTSTKETTEQAPVESKKSETADQVKADADKLMGKIDDILGEFNAEEFVASFVQKGGE